MSKKRFWLIEQRANKNYTQSEVADLLGISRQTVIRDESGDDGLTFGRLQMYAKLYGTTVSDMIPKSI